MSVQIESVSLSNDELWLLNDAMACVLDDLRRATLEDNRDTMEAVIALRDKLRNAEEVLVRVIVRNLD